MQGLGKLPGAEILTSRASGISADGSTIIGSATDDNRQTVAILWDDAGQMALLQNILVSQGAGPAIGNGLLRSAIDISSDARTIIGSGYGPDGLQGWIAILVPEPSCLTLLIAGSSFGLFRLPRHRS